MNSNNIYTAADIHQYLSGKMDATQMHAIEKAALDDPLLAEAIDGYNGLPGFNEPQGFDPVKNHLDELKGKINASSTKTATVKKMSSLWRAAAAILLLLGGTVLAIYINNGSKNKSTITVATNEPVTTPTIAEPIKDTPAKITEPDETKKITPPIVNTEKVKPVLSKIDNKTANDATFDDATAEPTISAKSDEMPPVTDKPTAAANQPYEENEIAAAKGKKANSLYKKSELNKESKIFFSGKVTDKNNKPIPFATITTSTGLTSTTDGNGQFSLSVTKDNTGKITFKAKNFQSKSIDASGTFQTIILDSKKIITDKKSNGNAGQAMVLNHKGAEPKEGWPKYIDFLVDKISYSEYDTGKPVVGETIVSFEINTELEPVNFTFEKQIDSDVNAAIEELIVNGPEWKIIDKASLPARIRLKLNF